MEYEVPYRLLASLALAHDRNLDKCMGALSTVTSGWGQYQVEELRVFLRKTFFSQWYQRRQVVSRNSEEFERKHASWLEKSFRVNSVAVEPLVLEDEYTVSDSCQCRKKSGRPPVEFAESSERSKRRKVKEIREDVDPELLTKAATKPKISPDRAFSYLLNNNLTKAQYENTRALLGEAGLLEVLPAYNNLRGSKAKCIPFGLQVTETGSRVPLASLLQHTASRILEGISATELESFDSELTLVAKWGCDGSSGHSIYKQAFAAHGVSDDSIFLTSMVPLQIRTRRDETISVWQNPRPSSTRLCRMIDFQYVKETKDVILAEVSRVEKEIAELRRTEVTVRGKSFYFQFELIFSMIDGKVLNYVNQTPSMNVCSICKASPSEMNNLDLIYAKQVTACYMTMSPLHARIKFMECLLKIAYNLPLHPDPTKSLWGKRLTPEQAMLKKQTKEAIQRKFQSRFGLHLDKVRKNFGNSNDGNTSRRFFADSAAAAEILGVEENLIVRFRTVLDTINCSGDTDEQKFETYCLETAKLYVSLYPWYPMTSTVHKVLVHGSRIMSQVSLPIGMLGEEAQEGENKEYRHNRLHHTRKLSRIATNEDLAKLMLARSDPYLYTFSGKSKSSPSTCNEDIRALLKDT